MLRLRACVNVFTPYTFSYNPNLQEVDLNIKLSAIMLSSLFASGCATIVNDPNIPVTSSFSDGSEGRCEFQNKRGLWACDIPGTVMIRRSDDALIYHCETEDGRKASGSIISEYESGKFAASIIFWDLGITDAITDKHRTYQGNLVIPVKKANDIAQADTDATGQSE